MTQNHGSRTPFILTAALMAMLATACSERRIIPAPTPTPTAPRPAQTQAPVLRPSATDWRDAPITPGDWRWSGEGGQSVARFANGALTLRCDPAARTVTLQRQGVAAQPAIVVLTSGLTRQLSAGVQNGATAATLAARDPLLDAVAFSRGRFAVETPGLPTLYVPSWPEISRVVEDCR